MENSKVLMCRRSLPDEGEIKKYFPLDVWSQMTDYEKLSYRNILHNFNIMVSLGLNPVKPRFMTNKVEKCIGVEVNDKKDRKVDHNRAEASTSDRSTKKSRFMASKTGQRTTAKKKHESILITQPTCKKQRKRDHSTIEASSSKNTLLNKCTAVFSAKHKYMCIRLDNIFSSTLRVYMSYERCMVITSSQHFSFLRKRQDLIVEENMGELMSVTGYSGIGEKISAISKISASKEDKVSGSGKQSNIKKLSANSCQNNETTGTTVVPLTATKSNKKRRKKKKLSPKKNKTGANQAIKDISHKQAKTKSSCWWQFKKPCRSVQTQTVPPGVSLQSSVLVFVSSLTAKNIKSELNGDEYEQCRKWLKEKEAKAPKKSRKNSRRVQTQTADGDASITDSKLVFFPTTKAKKPKAVQASASNQQENLISKEPQKSDCQIKQDVSNQRKEDQNVNAESSTPVAVAERRYPRRSVPVLNYAEPEIQEDEYLFCDLCDKEYEGDCPEHGPYIVFVDNYETGPNRSFINCSYQWR